MDRERGREATKFLFAAALLLIGYLALSAIAMDQYVPPPDRAVRAWVGPLRHGRLQLPMEAVSFLGEAAGLVPLIALTSLALIAVDRRWAMRLPLLMAGTGALQYATKWIANRPRPNAAPWGFPSGHVLSLTVFFGIVAYLIATSVERRQRLRVLVCSGCASMVVLVAFSRIYLDMHWLSDVVGGFAAGTVYLFLAIWALRAHDLRRASGSEVQNPPIS